MHSLKNSFFLILIVALLSSLAHAERFAKIIYYQAPADAPLHCYVYQGTKEPQKIKLDRRKFAPSFVLEKGDLKLIFLPKELPEGAPIPPNSPFVNIPAAWTNVVLFAIEDKKNPIFPIKIMPYNASDNVFAPGEFLFINNSRLMVGGTIGDNQINIKAKSLKVIESPMKERGVINLILDSYDPKTKERRNLIKKRWLHVPQFRNVLFVTDLPPPKMTKLYAAEIRRF